MSSTTEHPGVALVIGGTGGIGSATVRLLAQTGSRVVLTYRSSPDRAQELVDAFENVTALPLDTADVAASKTLVDQVAETSIQTLIFAAGPPVPQIHLSRVQPDDFAKALAAETAGFFNVVQPALPHLRASKGSIVAVTTAATDRYAVRDGLSAGPKAAIEALVRGIAAEEGRFGVRANSVGPGMLRDGMAEALTAAGHYDERALEVATNNIAMRRFGSCADVAEAICFLASDRANYISGQSLNVDGGYAL